VLFTELFHGLGLFILILGGLTHGWGMYDKRRIEQSAGGPAPQWTAALYWSCWALMAAGALIVLVRIASVG
jgi:hypothetical protein